MPFLPASGAISINDLNTFFTGSGTAMSNFYRGGGRVPSTKTTTTITREPSTGELFELFGRGASPPNATYWSQGGPDTNVYWDAARDGGGNIVSGVKLPFVFGSTSVTDGNITYFRGAFQSTISKVSRYAIFREVTTSSTVNINTGIPASGQISLNQFYGAEVP